MGSRCSSDCAGAVRTAGRTRHCPRFQRSPAAAHSLASKPRLPVRSLVFFAKGTSSQNLQPEGELRRKEFTASPSLEVVWG